LNKKVFIYGLQCPITEQIRYIGKSNKPKKRYTNHLNDKNDYHRNRWINKLKSLGLKPMLVIIDEVDECFWEEFEIKYIRLFKSFGADLVNTTGGGDFTPDSKGEKNCNWGKFGALHHYSKAVLVFDINGNFIEEFSSIKECEEKYKKASIVRCCKRILIQSKGYVFRYKSDYEEIPNSIQVNLKKYLKGSNHPTSIPVNQYSLDGVFINSFVSISEASEKTGMKIGSIIKIINNKTKPRKYEFRYKTN